MFRVWWVVVCLCFTTGIQASDRFIVFGDIQDSRPEGRQRDKHLIEQINALEPAFSVFIGDFKGGGERCSDALMDDMSSIFAAHLAPLVYTPGDNEWTDCWQTPAGAFDPIERKQAVVAQFTRDGLSLGKHPMPLSQQEGQRENAYWQWNGLALLTLHITGSNNNLRQDKAAAREHFARQEKNRLWLEASFDKAQQADAAAVVLFIHANPQWEAAWWNPTGFDDFRALLAERAQAFGRPVLVVHGDSHTFRIDKPLKKVANVTRLEVFGSPQRGAVIVAVDRTLPELFLFSPVLLDAK